jgi:hypothetical protein
MSAWSITGRHTPDKHHRRTAKKQLQHKHSKRSAEGVKHKHQQPKRRKRIHHPFTRSHGPRLAHPGGTRAVAPTPPAGLISPPATTSPPVATSPTTPSPAPPTNPPPSPPVHPTGTAITLGQAHRLLWRTGFGPTPGQAEALTSTSLQQAIYGLTRPSSEAILTGPEPTDGHGDPLDPAGVRGHDHCWWLDRMIRSDQQLVERMTLIWHDWFATSNANVNRQQLMLDQNNLFRENALGSFYDLFLAVTTDPAMLVFLNGIKNNRSGVNENYAREMMELFSLGADRGAYTQDDVHEMARALTGWRADWSTALHFHNFRFDPAYHDTSSKTVFGQSGNWDGGDAVRLCITHPLHPSFFVSKLWSYFIPTEPDQQTLASLEQLYISSQYSIRAVVETILQHPDFYEGPELVTPPIVYNAGLMRATGRYVDTTIWAPLGAVAGQQLFYPPNVSGWNFSSWLATSTVKARWEIANAVTANNYPNPWPQGGCTYDPTEDPDTAVAKAMAYWGNPIITDESRECISDFAETCINKYKSNSIYRAIRQNALRMLIAASPDMQVS